MSLRHVEKTRQYVVRKMTNQVIGLRTWLSMLDGTAPVLERLRGEPGEELVAVLTDALLRHLGHSAGQADPKAAASYARRAAKQAFPSG